MRKGRSYSISGLIIVLLVVILNSCLEDDSAERQADHDRKLNMLKSEYGMTESDVLEGGIYRKVIEGEDTSVYIESTDYIIADVIGKYAIEGVFDASDADIAEDNGLYRPDLVYGPYRLKIDQTFYGFYKALLGVVEGSEVEMVLSHSVAFLDYEPLAYEIRIRRIIKDIDSYLIDQDTKYMNELDIDPSVDIVPGTDSSIFWKQVEPGTDSIDLEIGDIVKLRLYGYYAEIDSNVRSGFPGRQFFPINESGDTISGEAGVQSFPIINSLYPAIAYMKIGEIRDIFIPSELAYGEEGFQHPFVGKFIIPKNMSLHYRVQLMGHTKWNER